MGFKGPELIELIDIIKDKKPITVRDTRQIVDQYFKENVIWSIVKDEWDIHMSETDKTSFCDALMKEL